MEYLNIIFTHDTKFFDLYSNFKFKSFKIVRFLRSIMEIKLSTTSFIQIYGHKSEKPNVQGEKQYPKEKQKQL